MGYVQVLGAKVTRLQLRKTGWNVYKLNGLRYMSGRYALNT